MNNKKRRSPIWKISREEFVALVDRSRTIGEVLAYFGMINHGSNYRTLRSRLDFENIDRTKFKGNFGNGLLKPIIPLENVLVENSNYNRCNLKRRLIKQGLLKEECSKCKLGPLWQGERLILVMDHINGVNNDNRLENLRLLCPNCNSQTDTFAGRNNAVKNKCEKCGKRKSYQSKLCMKCRSYEPRLSTRKVSRPSKEALKELLWKMPTSQLAKQFNVSDKAIEKWAKRYRIDKPPRGYWAKLQSQNKH
jgi:Zn finger protein HypA/HybF involved in hydrogenase expression